MPPSTFAGGVPPPPRGCLQWPVGVPATAHSHYPLPFTHELEVELSLSFDNASSSALSNFGAVREEARFVADSKVVPAACFVHPHPFVFPNQGNGSLRRG